MKRASICVIAVALFAGMASAADLATKKSLTLAAAKEIAAAAAREAAANKWTMVIAIVDDGANLVYLERMDDTQIGSVNIAIAKAETAVKMKRPSKALEDAVAGGRNVVMTIPGVLPVEGGVPIVVEGKVIGAIGVSGMSSQQDGLAAAAGLKVPLK
jgi:glc operon protein GlcG